MSREPGQGRRDLRRHTKPGALKKGHQKPGGCGKSAATMLLVGVVVVVKVVDWLR